MYNLYFTMKRRYNNKTKKYNNAKCPIDIIFPCHSRNTLIDTYLQVYDVSIVRNVLRKIGFGRQITFYRIRLIYPSINLCGSPNFYIGFEAKIVRIKYRSAELPHTTVDPVHTHTYYRWQRNIHKGWKSSHIPPLSTYSFRQRCNYEFFKGWVHNYYNENKLIRK